MRAVPAHEPKGGGAHDIDDAVRADRCGAIVKGAEISMGVKRAHDDAGGVVCISVRRKNGVVRNSFQARKGFYLAGPARDRDLSVHDAL